MAMAEDASLSYSKLRTGLMQAVGILHDIMKGWVPFLLWQTRSPSQPPPSHFDTTHLSVICINGIRLTLVKTVLAKQPAIKCLSLA